MAANRSERRYVQLHLGLLLEIAETAEQVARLRSDAMTSLPRRWDYALTLNSSPASTVLSAPERQQDQSTQPFEDRRFCSTSQAKVERRSMTRSCSMTSRAAAASSGLATLSAKIGYVACATAHSNDANTVSHACVVLPDWD